MRPAFRHGPSPESGFIGRDPTPEEVWNTKEHEYSRLSQPTSARAERVLSSINGGYAITYSSGLSASLAVRRYAQSSLQIDSSYA